MSAERDKSQTQVRTSVKLAVTLVMLAIVSTLLSTLHQYLTRPDVLPIEEMHIVGSFKHLDAMGLKALVEPRINGNFFAVDVDAIHQAVVDLPWVYAAWVDRIWPNVLQVRVMEQVPVAVWRDQALVNQDGDLFLRTTKNLPADIPVFYCEEAQLGTLLNGFNQFSQMFSATALRMQMLELDARKSWSMTLTNGMQFMLGKHDQHARLERFLRVYETRFKLNKKQIERVDLRYANGFAVRWKELSSARDKQVQSMSMAVV